MEEKKYDFGEKKEEFINGVNCPVWQTPKYLEAKKKVIETLESEKYKGVLSTSDFWILVNTYDNKTKAMYSGLIISHNGCLKINDTLENKVDPSKFTIDKDGYNNSLVYTYCDDEVYEVGEVSKSNCKNDYPYAMAYKRCFDRVVLKKCKLAYAGIYSDSEAEEFKEKPENQEEQEEMKAITKSNLNILQGLIKSLPEPKEFYNNILKVYNITDLAQLTNNQYGEILIEIKKVKGE